MAIDDLKDTVTEEDKLADIYNLGPMPDPFAHVPVEIDGSLAELPTTNYGKPLSLPKEPKKEDEPKGPGFFEAAPHLFAEQNTFINTLSNLSDLPSAQNPFSDPVPEHWNPVSMEAAQQVSHKYRPYVFESRSPLEQEARIREVLKLEDRDEYFSHAGWVSQILFGGLGFLSSPENFIFPMAKAYKGIAIGQNIIMNTMRAAPNLSAQIAIHRAADEASSVGGNFKAFLADTAADVSIAVVFTGVGAGISGSFRAYKTYAAKKIISNNFAGVATLPVLSSTGQLQGYKAVATAGSNVGAMEVRSAQNYIDSKFVNQGLFVIPHLTKAFAFIPSMRGLTSKYPSLNEFANRMGDHPYFLEGMKHLRAIGDSFEGLLSWIRDDAKLAGWDLEGFRNEANGIKETHGFTSAMKNIREKINNDDYISKSEFGKRVAMSINTGELDSNNSINQAAEYISGKLDGTWHRFLVAHGFDPETNLPRTARRYLFRHYDKMALNNNPREWRKVVGGALRDQDKIIQSWRDRIEPLEQAIVDAGEDVIKAGKGEIEAAQLALDDARLNLKEERSLLHGELRDNPDMDDLLEERNYLTTSQAEQLATLLEPLKKAQKEVRAKTEPLKKLKQKLSRVKSSLRNQKLSEEKRKIHIAKKSETEKAILVANKELDKLRAKVSEIDGALILRAKSRKVANSIPRHFFTVDSKSGQIIFRDPTEMPKFRQLIPEIMGINEDTAYDAIANSYRDTILEQTSENINMGVLSTMFKGSGFESPFKSRSILIADSILRGAEAGFLDNDLGKGFSTYAMTLGRRTAMKEMFPNVLLVDGLEHFRNLRAEEHRLEQKAAERIIDEKKRKKKLKRIANRFIRDKDYIKKVINVAMGVTNASQGTQKWTAAIRNWGAATMLGNVPITMITDLMAIPMVHGFLPFLRRGIEPSLTTLNSKLNSQEGDAIRQNAAHAMISIQHITSGHMDRLFANHSMSEAPLPGLFSAGLSKVAHLSGNLYGTNYVDNFFHRTVANIMQSNIMSDMFKYKAGTLSKKRHQDWLIYRLDPAEWADRFIASYKHSEGWESHGGYQSKYWDWADDLAKHKMAMTLRRGVKNTILQKGMFDAPFFMNNPIGSMLTMFKGWAFASTARYMIPTMQRADATRLLGMLAMMWTGILVDPLQRLSAGKSAELFGPGWQLKAITNGGFFGIITNAAQDVNILMHDQFFDRNERWVNRSLSGIVAGPAGTLVQNIWEIASMFYSGTANKDGLHRVARMIPMAQAMYDRKLVNDWIDHMGIPKNITQALKQNR